MHNVIFFNLFDDLCRTHFSVGDDVLSPRPFVAMTFFECHFLSFSQVFKLSAAGGVMEEKVFVVTVLDESESLVSHDLFDSSLHLCLCLSS